MLRFIKHIKPSKEYIKEIVRYAISFFFAWLVSALISDFPYFRGLIVQLKIANFFTLITTHGTNLILKLFNYQTEITFNTLAIKGTAGVIILYGCLGIRQFAFVVVFVLLQSGRYANKLWYIPLSIFVLYVLNCIRIAIIAFWQTINPNEVQKVHDITSPFIMYPAILFLWIFWLNKYGKANKLPK